MEWLSLKILGYSLFGVAAFALISGKQVRLAHLMLFAIAAITVCAANIRPTEVTAQGITMRGPADPERASEKIVSDTVDSKK